MKGGDDGNAGEACRISCGELLLSVTVPIVRPYFNNSLCRTPFMTSALIGERSHCFGAFVTILHTGRGGHEPAARDATRSHREAQGINWGSS